MTNKWIQFKNYIKSLELDYSDLFLAIGFLFSVPFYAFAWKFMVETDLSKIFLKGWMMIVCFSVTAICWGIYFYLEIKRGRLKNNIFLWAAIILAIIALVGVLIQPSHIAHEIVCRKVGSTSWELYPGVKVGDKVLVTYDVSPTHRMFFAFGAVIIVAIYFIVLTLLPKRVKDLYFLVFCALAVFAFLLVISAYSFIAESDHYIPFIKAFFHGDTKGMYDNSVESLMTHRVPYGVCMMLGCMFSILCHAITKKWYWWIAFAYCYINMIFTWCKTALLITPIVVFIYFLIWLIESFKANKKRNTIISVVVGSIIGVGLILFVVSVATDGAILSPINNLVKTYTETDTIKTRTYIWDNIKTSLSGGWWIIGRGFGIHNAVIYPMNILNNDKVCPSHSTYFAVLGQGGIFTLIAFLAGYIYYGYIFYKCFRVNKYMTMKLSIPFVAYFMYSFTEGVNYLIVVFMFPLLLYHGLIQRGLMEQDKTKTA